MATHADCLLRDPVVVENVDRWRVEDADRRIGIYRQQPGCTFLTTWHQKRPRSVYLLYRSVPLLAHEAHDSCRRTPNTGRLAALAPP